MERTEARDDHEKFRELCALGQAKSLSLMEQLDLELHLKVCPSCRQLYDEYAVIAEEGMTFLAENYAPAVDAYQWDDREVRQRLRASIANQKLPILVPLPSNSHKSVFRRFASGFISSNLKRAVAIGSLAACALVVITWQAYRIGEKKGLAALPIAAVPTRPQPTLVSAQASDRESTTELTTRLLDMEALVTNREKELARLRAESDANERLMTQLQSEKGASAAILQQTSEERDRLSQQLEEAGKAYKSLLTEFSNLKSEHSRSLLQTASLEAQVTELTTARHDHERRLAEDEQFLSSDRDIRELMGARKLYIADVFDVDSASRTRKPFGRVFYTQSKSLVFYAFDLDHQPGVKNASVFQVWGQRDGESNGEAHPMNLGVLYMDSETNRRWVLRSDDPKQLAEIDAVFVTVEPHVGSQKPSGKPLLYALLRKEANHP